jgi:hypothetical protein
MKIIFIRKRVHFITITQISLTQFYKLSFSEGKRKMPVNSTEINTGFPIVPGGTLNQVTTRDFFLEF